MHKIGTVHFYILIISISLAIIFGLYNKLIPILFHHAIYLCQKTQSLITLPLPHTGPLLISGIFIALMASGVIKTAIEIIKTKAAVNNLIKNKIEVSSEVLKICSNIVPPSKLDIIESNQIISMCYGLFSPRICISTSLINSLNIEELRCVLVHESAHLKNYDPIKLLTVQLISSFLFFIPILKDFQKHFYLLQETKADSSVLKNEENKKHLRTALAKFLKHNTFSGTPVVSFASENTLEERIRILVGISNQPKMRLSFVNIGITAIFMALALSFLQSPLYAIQTSNSDHSYVICTAGSQCISYCKENTALEILEDNAVKSNTQINYSSIK